MAKQQRKTTTPTKSHKNNKGKKTKKAVNLHDAFFKQTFSYKEVVESYLLHFLDKKLLQNIDLGSLILEPVGYVTPELEEYFADLVWVAKYNGKAEIKIAFLFEHKSYVVPYPHIQLMRYILEHLEKQIKDNELLTVVLPIIVYHGEDKWKVRPFADYFEGIDEVLKPYIPTFKYQLTDLSHYSDQELIKMDIGKLLNVFLAMIHIRDTNYIRQNFETIFIAAEKYLPEGGRFFELIFVYLYKNVDLTRIEIEEIVQTIQSPIKNFVMSTYDYAMREGAEKVIEKGIEIALLHTNLTPQEIAEKYEANLAKVMKVKDRLVTLNMLQK